MLAHRRAVDRVVGGHDAPGVGVLDDGLEGGQVQLAQGAFGDQVVDGEAVGLGVVGHEVLDGGADAAGLDAVHIAGSDPPGEIRVLAVRLEVPAAQRGAVQVDGGREEDVDALAAGLLGQQHACPAGQFGVPGGGEGGRGGQGDGGVVGGPAGAADTDRAVGHDEGPQPDLGESGQRPAVLPGQEPGLGVQVEPAESRLDAASRALSPDACGTCDVSVTWAPPRRSPWTSPRPALRLTLWRRPLPSRDTAPVRQHPTVVSSPTATERPELP